jgi:hypothetical protein
MPAVSLWQPWASLIAVGAKTIETRSWPAPKGLIGQRIAIHAAKTTKGFDTLPGDCEGNAEGGWRYGYIGDFQAAYCFRSGEGTRGDAYIHRLEPPELAEVNPIDIPLGAVVATARLDACLPMVWRDDWPDARTWQDGPAVEVHASGLQLWPEQGVTDRARDVTDQLEYGDFAAGRWAWLLSGIEALDESTPAKGMQGIWQWETGR